MSRDDELGLGDAVAGSPLRHQSVRVGPGRHRRGHQRGRRGPSVVALVALGWALLVPAPAAARISPASFAVPANAELYDSGKSGALVKTHPGGKEIALYSVAVGKTTKNTILWVHCEAELNPHYPYHYKVSARVLLTWEPGVTNGRVIGFSTSTTFAYGMTGTIAKGGGIQPGPMPNAHVVLAVQQGSTGGGDGVASVQSGGCHVIKLNGPRASTRKTQ